jgi:hypothetical protein
MTDSRPTSGDESRGESDEATGSDPPASTEPGDDTVSSESELSDAELRARVEERYDFEDFGPQDMAEMTPDEWDAAFDPDSWITGEALLDRVETDLQRRVAERDVFAVVEREPVDGRDAVLAYSDEGYAVVHGDGSVEGFGTVLRDVKPTVALCSMESYEPAEAPAGAVLPDPDQVPEGSGELGNLMLQVIAAVLGVAGVVLFAAAIVAPGAAGTNAIGRGLMVVFALVFLAAAVVLFFTVANARLSDKFRAEEYRDRLRAVGIEDGERPDFLPTNERDAAPDIDTDRAADAAGDGYPDSDDDAAGDGYPDSDDDAAGDGDPDSDDDAAGDGDPDSDDDAAGDGDPDSDDDAAGDGDPDSDDHTAGDAP